LSFVVDPSSPSVRIKLTIAYRGTHYHGWQRQEIPPTWKGETLPDHGLPTVQECLEKAIKHVVRHPLNVVGSSRTDSGVHAKGQVVHFDTDKVQIPVEGFRRAINSRLPGDINVVKLEHTPATFDAIGSTVSKRYQYVIWNAIDRNPHLYGLDNHRWQTLDVDLMRQAAASFVGTHDFVGFAKAGHGRESTVRTIFNCAVSKRKQFVVIGVEGSGFLWNQIRIMAGTLLEIGHGELPADRVRVALESGERRLAGRTAPANGLYLQWIKFASNSEPA